jgi:hypothetical protein
MIVSSEELEINLLDREEWIESYGSAYLRSIDSKRGKKFEDAIESIYATERGIAEYPSFQVVKVNWTTSKIVENPTRDLKRQLLELECSGYIAVTKFGRQRYVVLTPSWLPSGFALQKRSSNSFRKSHILLGIIGLTCVSIAHFVIQNREPELLFHRGDYPESYSEMNTLAKRQAFFQKIKNPPADGFEVNIEGRTQVCEGLIGYDSDNNSDKKVTDYRCWDK